MGEQAPAKDACCSAKSGHQTQLFHEGDLAIQNLGRQWIAFSGRAPSCHRFGSCSQHVCRVKANDLATLGCVFRKHCCVIDQDVLTQCGGDLVQRQPAQP